MDTTCDIAIIGGGISGLTAAWHLQRSGVDVRLFEKDETVGGATRTLRHNGFLLEQGPFNVLVRDPTFEELLGDLDEDIEVIRAGSDARIRYIYLHGRLHKVPTNPLAMITSGLIGAGAKLRVMAEPLLARRPSGPDPTIADFAARHFGRQFANNVVGAVVSGIFGGDIDRLSVGACFPAIGRVDRDHRSLMLYGLAAPFRKSKTGKKHKRRWRGMVSVTGGLGAMTSAVGARLGSALLAGHAIEALESTSEGYRVHYRSADHQGRLQCRRLLLTTAAEHAADLLDGCGHSAAVELATCLRSIESVPLVVLNLGFERRAIGHDLRGFGFLVPPSEPEFPLMGVLFANSIFPEHAPADHHLLRVFIGGARHQELTTRSDDELVALSLETLTDLLQISGPPMLVQACRYPQAIPQYFQGHVDKVQQIRELEAQVTGLRLAGNYLEGVSLNDCVRLARRTAHDMIAETEPTAAPLPG